MIHNQIFLFIIINFCIQSTPTVTFYKLTLNNVFCFIQHFVSYSQSCIYTQLYACALRALIKDYLWLSSPDLCSAGIADSAAIPTIPIQESRAVQETLRQWQNLCFQIIRSTDKKFQWFYFSKMEESAEQ